MTRLLSRCLYCIRLVWHEPADTSVCAHCLIRRFFRLFFVVVAIGIFTICFLYCSQPR